VHDHLALSARERIIDHGWTISVHGGACRELQPNRIVSIGLAPSMCRCCICEIGILLFDNMHAPTASVRKRAHILRMPFA
jgi:hypothetical protein